MSRKSVPFLFKSGITKKYERGGQTCGIYISIPPTLKKLKNITQFCNKKFEKTV